MERDKKVHDLAVAAAAVATFYNKDEIDNVVNASERIDFIASDIALRYDDCYKIIDSILKE